MDLIGGPLYEALTHLRKLWLLCLEKGRRRGERLRCVAIAGHAAPRRETERPPSGARPRPSAGPAARPCPAALATKNLAARSSGITPLRSRRALEPFQVLDMGVGQKRPQIQISVYRPVAAKTSRLLFQRKQQKCIPKQHTYEFKTETEHHKCARPSEASR